MTDTSPEIAEKMIRTRLMALSGAERSLMMGVRMCAAARRMALASLPADLPKSERKRLLFERIYGELPRLSHSMRIPEDVRKYAAEQAISEDAALKKGMAEPSAARWTIRRIAREGDAQRSQKSKELRGEGRGGLRNSLGIGWAGVDRVNLRRMHRSLSLSSSSPKNHSIPA